MTALSARGSWTLSPVFDVNPNSDPHRARSTSIVGADAPPDEAEALLALAEECSLTPDQARQRMTRVASAVAGWRDAARKNGVRELEITMMADSIEVRLGEVVGAASKA